MLRAYFEVGSYIRDFVYLFTVVLCLLLDFALFQVCGVSLWLCHNPGGSSSCMQQMTWMAQLISKKWVTDEFAERENKTWRPEGGWRKEDSILRITPDMFSSAMTEQQGTYASAFTTWWMGLLFPACPSSVPGDMPGDCVPLEEYIFGLTSFLAGLLNIPK